jgi:hypothetical protein
LRRVHAGDFLARDERQGNPREAAAEEADVPRADTRHGTRTSLASHGHRVWQLSQPYAADSARLLHQHYSHDSGLLTLYCATHGSRYGLRPYRVLTSRCSPGAAGSAPELRFCAQGRHVLAGRLGLQGGALLPDLQRDLGGCVGAAGAE